jgi:hypothetical protein
MCKVERQFRFKNSELYELNGETQVGVLPEIVIQWDELAARLPVDY